MFKTNSRFAALAEEVPLGKDLKKNKKNNEPEKKVKNEETSSEDNKFKNEINSFKSDENSFKRNFDRPQRYDDRSRNSYTNRYSKEEQERRQKEEQLRKEEDERIKTENFEKSMAPENFPDLVTTTKKEVAPQKNYISFVEKINTEVVKKKDESKYEDPDLVNLKPGWAISKFDPVTNRIITKYKESNQPTPIEKTENELAYDVLKALCDLHERRTAEYIEMWGYDTWEKMFRSPNWDYEYFDRLDQEYEEEMERLAEEESGENEDFVTDYDRHNNYWKNY